MLSAKDANGTVQKETHELCLAIFEAARRRRQNDFRPYCDRGVGVWGGDVDISLNFRVQNWPAVR